MEYIGATFFHLEDILLRHVSPPLYIGATCFPSIIYWCDMFPLHYILVRHVSPPGYIGATLTSLQLRP